MVQEIKAVPDTQWTDITYQHTDGTHKTCSTLNFPSQPLPYSQPCPCTCPGCYRAPYPRWPYYGPYWCPPYPYYNPYPAWPYSPHITWTANTSSSSPTFGLN